MTGDRALGIQYLTVWYQQSGLIFQGRSFADVVAAYDARVSNFIENFGASIRISKLPDFQIRAALQNIAVKYPGQVPDYNDFFTGLIDEVNGVTSTIRIWKDAFAETGKTVATVATVGLAGYATVVAIAIGAAVFLNLRKSMNAAIALAILAVAGVFAYGSSSLATGSSGKPADPDPANSDDPFFAFDTLFKKYCLISGVDLGMMKAICLNESRLGQEASVALGIQNPNDVDGSASSDGKSWGLMQMTIPTARDYDVLATAQKLNDPEYSIKIAAKHLALLQRLFPLTEVRWEEWVVKSYNQGQGNTAKERRGEIAGYAEAYYSRYLSNRKTVLSKQGV